MTLDGVPEHAPGLRLRDRDGRTVLVDASGEAHVLNATALALWELCDGETTAGEMSAAVESLFAADSEVIVHDVTETLERLTAAGLLLWTAGTA